MSDIHIKNYDTPDPVAGQTWDTTQLQEDFDVVGFAAPVVVVKRKADGVTGTLMFKHQPRVYWGFQPDAGSY